MYYNQHINKVFPHFTFMRQAQNTDTHALTQPRLSQNISPVCSSFVLVIACDMHLESKSEKRAKALIYTQLKNIQIQSTLFRYFQTNSYKLTSDLFTVIWSVFKLLAHRKNTVFSEQEVSTVFKVHAQLERCLLCAGSLYTVFYFEPNTRDSCLLSNTGSFYMT